MKKAILGTKVGMTQMFREDGTMIPVTVVLAGPCPVVQKKTVEHDGYEAVQVAFKPIREKLCTKPMLGHFKKAGQGAYRYTREFKLDDTAAYEVGQVITVDAFQQGDMVDVTGTSKGKGFQGTIKRWNFSRGPMTHGSRNQRRPGSIGQCAYPARVRKGLHMYGHMGDERVTVKNLKLVRIDAEQNLMLVKGAVPGGKNALVQVRMA